MWELGELDSGRVLVLHGEFANMCLCNKVSAGCSTCIPVKACFLMGQILVLCPFYGVMY